MPQSNYVQDGGVAQFLSALSSFDGVSLRVLDEAKECIEVARKVKEFVLRKLGVEGDILHGV